jgi:hypothetical protein
MTTGKSDHTSRQWAKNQPPDSDTRCLRIPEREKLLHGVGPESFLEELGFDVERQKAGKTQFHWGDGGGVSTDDREVEQ